jgi:polysaccharide export outer membrane protein
MVRGFLQLALVSWLAAAAAAAGEQEALAPPKSVVPPPSVVPDDYQIGPGDVLQIIVWKEQEATVPSVVVRSDGRVGLPFVKEVDLAGLTPAQAEQAITSGLKPFINEPDVTVIVREVHSKRIYMVGAIKHEGPIDLKYPMTMLQALSEAGGLTDYAKRKRIYILRQENGKETRIYFNYDSVIKGEQMEQNIQVMPGDTIVAPH